jgi:hypothetical protein
MLANISVGFTKAVFVHGGHSSAEVQKSAGKCLADDSARIPTEKLLEIYLSRDDSV